MFKIKGSDSKKLSNNILTLSQVAALAKKNNPNVINATIGMFNNEDDEFYTFKSVSQVLKEVSFYDAFSYADTSGGEGYQQAILKWVFGDYLSSFKSTHHIGVIATPGGSGAIATTFQNYLTKGDNVLVPSVMWETYITMAKERECGVLRYDLYDSDNNFNLSDLRSKILELMNKQESIILVINDPCHNPTGFCMKDSDYDALVDLLNEYDYPDDCIIDFDFRMVDLFISLAEKEMKIEDKVKAEYFVVKDKIGHRPSRVEFFINMDDGIYDGIKSKAKLNPFNNYLQFLKDNNELTEEEEVLYNSRGREFINMIETTSMSKTYKMPVLLAFYNDGDVKINVDEEDIYNSFYKFYHKGSNKVDMLQHKSTKDFEFWDKSNYVKLAKDNPVKFLLKTHGDFFKINDGYVISLMDDMKDIVVNSIFKEHMKDAIELRTIKYYKERKFK